MYDFDQEDIFLNLATLSSKRIIIIIKFRK